MTKSFVTMEQEVCAVCLKEFDTGSILMDRRMKDIFERTTTTGYGICPEHSELRDNGYVALIACDPKQSAIVSDKVTLEEAHRTGRIAHVRATAAHAIFGMEIDPAQTPFMFVEDEVIDYLEANVPPPDDSV